MFANIIPNFDACCVGVPAAAVTFVCVAAAITRSGWLTTIALTCFFMSSMFVIPVSLRAWSVAPESVDADDFDVEGVRPSGLLWLVALGSNIVAVCRWRTRDKSLQGYARSTSLSPLEEQHQPQPDDDRPI